jgi:RNA polymerase sigma-70 factor (ECF subfamily)
MSAVAAGDRAALAELYDRYAGALLGLGIRVLRDRREAEDVVHDVFLEVWRQAHRFDDGRGSVRAWMLLTMRSRALDRRRSHGYARSRPLLDDGRAAPASESPAMVIDRARVIGALERLGEAQRAVLVLGYFEGLSSSEIAERLSLPIGTVKSRVASAIRALRDGLGTDRDEASELAPEREREREREAAR